MGGGAKGPGPSGTETSRTPELIEEGSEGVPAVPRDAASETSPASHCAREGGSVPLASPSDVGTQGKGRVRVRCFSESPMKSRLERQKAED
eukprot:1143275-Pleurochrysis_carterae.AAC.2